MPANYRRPASVKQAQVFVGAVVELYWNETETSPEGWFPGTITKVTRLPSEAADELYFNVE